MEFLLLTQGHDPICDSSSGFASLLGARWLAHQSGDPFLGHDLAGPAQRRDAQDKRRRNIFLLSQS
jgi:hypothetical protein